jgi:hypothetical protein
MFKKQLNVTWFGSSVRWVAICVSPKLPNLKANLYTADVEDCIVRRKRENHDHVSVCAPITYIIFQTSFANCPFVSLRFAELTLIMYTNNDLLHLVRGANWME